MHNLVSTSVFEQWSLLNSWISGSLSRLKNHDLSNSLFPGGNHGIWILGHLIESEDELSVFLGKGPFLYPEYESLFGQGSALLPVDAYPDADFLREQWRAVSEKNRVILSGFRDEEWNEPHAGPMADPDYFGTKGRCFLIWNLHQAMHNGQLASLLSMVRKSQQGS